jgi:predicted metal-dependent phosphoesterase TrpH
MGTVDLHIHTTASDGVLTPFEVVQEAAARKLTVIAITDHDTTAGIDEALKCAESNPVHVIPGIELSSEQGRDEIHLLGYYLDHHSQILQENLQALKEARHERAHKMAQRLALLGMPLRWERIEEIAGETSAFGRPHIARALQEKGYVTSVEEAFDRYIGREGPAYVERYKLTPREAIEIITGAGGLPVLAHPRGREHVLPELVHAGLIGLEAYYPGYTIADREALVRLAEQYDLIPLGGTDFHSADGFSAVALGEVWVPPESVARLRSLAEG